MEKTSDIKVNLIVSGNLTVKEPQAAFNRELFVLGRTFVRSLQLEGDENILLFGGLTFETPAI